MKDQIAVQNFLNRKFTEFKRRNSSFSLRAFSKKMGLNSGATSEIMKGNRRVTRKVANKIALSLNLDPLEKNELLRHFEEKPKKIKPRSKDEAMIAADYVRVGADEFKVIAHWIHFAILNFTHAKGFKSDIKHIAERLSVTEGDVRDAIERLQRLKLIEVKTDGTIIRTSQKVYTTDELHSTSIQQSHLSDMRRAEKVLESVPVELRDFTALTFTANPKNLAKAKEVIRKLQDEVADELQNGDQTEVYKLSVYLYPLTGVGGKK